MTGSIFCRTHVRTSARSSEVRISSRVASAIHLPDALIQSVPSSLIEMFPALAWVNRRLPPTRADSSRKELISVFSVTWQVFIHRLLKVLLRKQAKGFF